jgi:hypothetical protein
MILFDIRYDPDVDKSSTLDVLSKLEPTIVFLLMMGAVAIITFITYKISKRK